VGAVLAKALPPPSLAWLVWSLGAALYFFAFFQRVAPAVITRELSAEFELTGAALGNLSAFYYYSYVAVQIPTGLAADRWGPRRLLAAGATLTAVGTLIFALAPSLAWASAGRLVIGASVGVAFVCMLKLVTHWMPARNFAFVSAVALVVGVAGATAAGAPLRMAVDAFGWRTVMVAAAVATAAIAIAIWVVMRDDPMERGYASYYPAPAPQGPRPSMMEQLREVLSYRNTWLLLLIPGGLSGVLLTFAGLWGVPFLESQYGFSPREAALVTSGMLVLWSLSSLAYGPLSQRIGRRKPLYAVGLVALMVLWAAVVWIPGLPRAVLLLLLAGVAMSAGAFVLTFAFGKESVPARFGGTVSGVTNMGVMLGGMFMQPLVGLTLDRLWNGAMAGGVRVSDFAAYRSAFSLMLVWAAASLVLLAFTRETYCRQAR
jgi:predicted MFS family arabinose efflux permease